MGTLQVLPEDERKLFSGIVINKFRGVRDLLQPGLDWLENYTGLPIVGVLPWLDFALPAEDSMSLFEQRGRKRSAELEIAVIRLPRIANFTDFDPLGAEPSVRLRYVSLTEPLGSPDAVIVPGSKATIPDLLAMQESGMAEQLRRFSGAIAGICGGLQMLGREIADAEGLEGQAGRFSGLGLLPLETALTGDKVTQLVTTRSQWLGSWPVQGYEIHQGRSQFGRQARPMFDRQELGCVSEDGRVWGSYLHGLFDNHAWRRQWLNRVRRSKGLPPLPVLEGHYSEERDRLLDRLADSWQSHLHLDRMGYRSNSH